MQKSSEEIRKNVYLTNVYYTKLQNKTKELYFSYLDKNKSYDDFEKELSKIWDNIDHGFMDKQIDKLEKMVNSNNVEEAINLGRLDGSYKNTEYWVIDEEYFKLTPESQFKKLEQRFKQNVLNQYKLAKKTITLAISSASANLLNNIFLKTTLQNQFALLWLTPPHQTNKNQHYLLFYIMLYLYLQMVIHDFQLVVLHLYSLGTILFALEIYNIFPLVSILVLHLAQPHCIPTLYHT